MKGTLLAEECTFSSAPQLLDGNFLKIHNWHCMCMRHKRCNTCYDLLLIEGNLKEELCTLLGCILAPNGGICLKIHTFRSTHMRYKRVKFCLYRSVVKGTLPKEHCTFLLYLVFHWGICLKIHTSRSTHILYKRSKFCSYRSVIKGTLPKEHCTFLLYLVFHWRDLPENSHLSLHSYVLQTKQVLSLSVCS